MTRGLAGAPLAAALVGIIAGLASAHTAHAGQCAGCGQVAARPPQSQPATPPATPAPTIVITAAGTPIAAATPLPTPTPSPSDTDLPVVTSTPAASPTQSTPVPVLTATPAASEPQAHDTSHAGTVLLIIIGTLLLGAGLATGAIMLLR